jgi:ribonuclease HI
MWQKPSIGWLKCNVDAAFHKELNKTSVGWCLRDHMGRFVMAGTKEGNCSVPQGESIALLEELKVVEHMGRSQVIFETDSKSVVDAIQHSNGGSAEFSIIISHVKNVLLSFLTQKMYCYLIQTLWLILLRNKIIWLLTL